MPVAARARGVTIPPMRPPDPVPLRFARGTLLAWEPPARRPGAPALLLLHGAACGPWVWEEGFAARLAAAGHPVFAPGFHRGSAAAPAGIADFAEDARAALAAIRRPAVLLGHSLGGLVAQRLLPSRPCSAARCWRRCRRRGSPGPTGGSPWPTRRSGARWRG
jgi:pimeloyl-ACP methyl ester carboxylesterase